MSGANQEQIIDQFESLLEPTQEAESQEEEAHQPETQEVEGETIEASESDEYEEQDTDVEVDEAEFDPDDTAPVFTVKVNGKELEVTEEELKSGYMKEQDYRHKTMELAEQRKQLDAAIQGRVQEFEAAQQQLFAGFDYLNKQLQAEYEGIDWQELKEDDPGLYAAKKHEKSERETALATHVQNLLQQSQAQKEQLLQQQQQQQMEYLQKERDAVLSALPEWKDEAKANAEKQDIAKFMRDIGYNDNDINNIYDHRALLMARKAMLYDKLYKNDVAKKKAKKPLPKVVKGGARQSAEAVQAERRRKNIKRLRTTKDKNVQTDAFMDFV